MTAEKVPFYAIDVDQADPRIVATVREIVLIVGAELGLSGTVTVLFIAPGDTLAPAACVGTSFSSWHGSNWGGQAIGARAVTADWPPSPTILLVCGRHGPETVLHELRHLWQIETGFAAGDMPAREADAERFALDRITRGPWRRGRRTASREPLFRPDGVPLTP